MKRLEIFESPPHLRLEVLDNESEESKVTKIVQYTAVCHPMLMTIHRRMSPYADDNTPPYVTLC